jgi:hypothetical protein
MSLFHLWTSQTTDIGIVVQGVMYEDDQAGKHHYIYVMDGSRLVTTSLKALPLESPFTRRLRS